MELKTLEAVTARILPSGNGPGARETGVAGYIVGALEHPFSRKLRGPMAAGLERVDAAARRSFGHPFADCSEEQQDEILTALQNRVLDAPEFPAHFFFEILITLAIEGFLCDPVHGGNRGGLGWKFLGASPAPPSSDLCLEGGASP